MEAVILCGVQGAGKTTLLDELWHATAAPDGGWRIEPLLVTPPLPGL